MAKDHPQRAFTNLAHHIDLDFLHEAYRLTRKDADAVLFDMDGTLVDSNSVVDQMWTEFAVTLGLDPQAVRAFAHGTPSTATLGNFLPAHEDFDKWFERIASWEEGSFGQVSEIAGAIAAVRQIPPGANTDRGVLEANLVVAYFAYVNRIADGLGVALEPPAGE